MTKPDIGPGNHKVWPRSCPPPVRDVAGGLAFGGLAFGGLAFGGLALGLAKRNSRRDDLRHDDVIRQLLFAALSRGCKANA